MNFGKLNLTLQNRCVSVQSFRDECQLSKSNHINLLSAIEFAIPVLKGKLVDVREALKGRQRAEPIQHTVPNTKTSAALFAAHLASKGIARMGAAHFVQTETGLRSSELLNVFGQHVRLPRNNDEVIVLRLGAVYSTKAKREQFVMIYPVKHRLSWVLVQCICKIVGPDERLFPLFLLGISQLAGSN